jgi:MYXO-CTERM domain-containing protein
MTGSGGMTGSGAGTTTGSGSGGSSATICASEIFVPGEVPTHEFVTEYDCGEKYGASASEGIAATPLTGSTYVVAVVAIDAVENYGPISNIACAAPEEVTDFFDAYTAAGGKGGGGLCSCSLVGGPAESSLALLMLFALGMSLARRRGRA